MDGSTENLASFSLTPFSPRHPVSPRGSSHPNAAAAQPQELARSDMRRPKNPPSAICAQMLRLGPDTTRVSTLTYIIFNRTLLVPMVSPYLCSPPAITSIADTQVGSALDFLFGPNSTPEGTQPQPVQSHSSHLSSLNLQPYLPSPRQAHLSLPIGTLPVRHPECVDSIKETDRD